MNKFLAAAILVPLGFAGTSFANAADYAPYQRSGEQGGVRIGYLTCEVGGGVGYVIGSAKTVDCTFSPTMGNKHMDSYSGTLRKMGVDLGFTTRGKLVWAVFAPTAGYHEGSLSGVYQGATAEATVGAGVGANILVGGTAGSIQLQTISLTGQLGLNVAATGTSLTLNSVN